ncbi:tyrosine-type recombinase/integrase [Halorarius halobius]|uniref:tyrosine-type recombinase/integrase n=1 Tax=Halorarius halobius TaxID=2962671 RepID=UPI0020CC0D43|nr:tyrosine-type recombinase/integrase [Halorarius halobius]
MASDATDAPAPEDPVAYFLQDLTYHGKTQRTREAYERVLRDFEAFARTQRGTTLQAATQRECMAWVHGLRDENSASTVATYASYLHRFYGYMVQVGAFDTNPMTLVVEEMDESIDTDPARREIMLPAMREFVTGVRHPLDRALLVTLLKTGIRVGELCNLDVRDIHLADGDVAESYETGHRGALDGRPDSLYVDDEPSRGTVVNGEERTESNKRKRATVVPVDEELKRVLKRWLAVRPDARSPAEPLFCSTSEWGRRLTIGMVGRTVADHAAEAGWYQPGGGAEENVTPHYFRHFFTTHLRDRTGDRGVVKYLRGDVASDIIDTYTHNWGDRVREVYEANIYSLL